MTEAIVKTMPLQADSEHTDNIPNPVIRLEDLLAGSPKVALVLDEEDKQWLNH